MKTIIIAIIFAAIVGTVVHKVTEMLDMETIAETLEENEKLKIDIQYAENEAYRDCQVMLQTNAKIQRVDGCMRTIEILCNERTTGKTFELCMKTFMPVCGRLDE